MASAAFQVFAIFELAELIFAKVPTRRLLLCRRVAKVWRNTVDSSTKLQRNLYYQSNMRPIKTPKRDREYLVMRSRLSVLHAFLTYITVTSVHGANWTYTSTRYLVEYNPLLLHAICHTQRVEQEFSGKGMQLADPHCPMFASRSHTATPTDIHFWMSR